MGARDNSETIYRHRLTLPRHPWRYSPAHSSYPVCSLEEAPHGQAPCVRDRRVRVRRNRCRPPSPSNAARSPGGCSTPTAWRCQARPSSSPTRDTGFTRERDHRRHRRLLGAEPRARHLRRGGRRWPASATPRATGWCWPAGVGGHARAEDAGGRRAGERRRHRRVAAGRDARAIRSAAACRAARSKRCRRTSATSPALTQLIPGMTPNPAASTFEGGQVVANGTPSQQNVYLIDGMYNNDDRLGGSQGTQVRVVLDNIEEYQVLANQYSSEYGGGAGAIINMVTRGGTNDFRGRVYSYFRDETLQRPRQVPARRSAQAARADAAGRLRPRRPDRPATARTSTSPTSATTRTSPARSGFRPRRRRWPCDRSAPSRCAPPTTSPAATCS